MTVQGDVDKSKLYTVGETAATLRQYIKSRGLASEDGATITLDDVLVNGLYKGFGRKKGTTDEDLPTEGDEADMLNRMQKRLLEYHRVVGLPSGPIEKKGHVPDVRLEENRAHGHNVTLISGLETFGCVFEASNTMTWFLQTEILVCLLAGIWMTWHNISRRN